MRTANFSVERSLCQRAVAIHLATTIRHPNDQVHVVSEPKDRKSGEQYLSPRNISISPRPPTTSDSPEQPGSARTEREATPPRPNH